MVRKVFRLTAIGAMVITLALLTSVVGVFRSNAQASGGEGFVVVGTGLNSPRGLTFGPDGNIYVAEAGLGGTHSTIGQCQQVPGAPTGPGPYTGGKTARISEINSNGVRSTVVDHLPSATSHEGGTPQYVGVSDVKFIGNQLYALLSGGGCSHGNPGIPNGIIRVERGEHEWHLIANLSHYIQTHPVKHPNAGDFEPDGTWYSMVARDNSLYAVEPNHGELDRVRPTGDQDNSGDSIISRIIDISASQGHAVPTASTFYKGNFYVTTFTGAYIPGVADVYKITPDGQISAVVSGLKQIILGITFDRQGRMLLLEPFTGNGSPVGAGAVVRMNQSGSFDPVVIGLSLPTAMTFGADGHLYVSNFGVSISPTGGDGQIVRSTGELNV
ncbi:MAG: hypothetical protein NVS4B12_05210 [Ktedonobacteraceae bacterium]